MDTSKTTTADAIPALTRAQVSDQLTVLGELRLLDGLMRTHTPCCLLDRQMRVLWANDPYLAATHVTRDDLIGRGLFDVFPDIPDRVERVRGHIERAFAGQANRMPHQTYNIETPDGLQERHWATEQEPVVDADGEVRWVLQRALDITDQIEAVRERALVAAELNHRTKNVFAVVQALTRMAAREHETKEEFAADLMSRLGAMSRIHSRLYANDFTGIGVREMITDELATLASKDTFSLSGPDAGVNARMARDLSMVIHELATNAAKYGCLSVPGGHLRVDWEPVGEDLTIEWRETGAGPVGPLSETGFGSKLLRMVRGIDVHRTATDEGLHVRLNCAGYRIG